MTNNFFRRSTLVMWIGTISILAGLTFPVCGQTVSWVGINEGGLISLPQNIGATNLTVTATPTISTSPTNMVFLLERQGITILTLTSPPPYTVTFTNLTTGKYFVSAFLVSGVTVLGDLSFDIVSASSRPANDDWQQATTIPGLNSIVTESNVKSTRQANEPSPSGTCVGKSIWWTWTAASNGVFTATTAGSDFDTALGVYTGTNLAALQTVGANDDAGPNSFSQVSFPATLGTKYYFMVDGVNASANGVAHLKLLSGSPPQISITSPPDGFLILVPSTAFATNVQATVAVNDPTGIAQLKYWFDGGTNLSRSGTLTSPYQLNLTNLLAGQYLLSVAASNNLGLVSMTNLGLSVISLEPVLVMEGFAWSPGKFQVGITGFKGPKYTLQTSTNLEVWCGVNTWTNFAGAAKVADTNIVQFQQRYYRASSGQ